MNKYSGTISTAVILLFACGLLISSLHGETFRGKVVLAGKPAESVADAAVVWYAVGKNSFHEGNVQTGEKGEFKVETETSDLLVLVFNKEGTHSAAAVLTPQDETTLQLSPGKSVTLRLMLAATEKDKPTPLADRSLSLYLFRTDKKDRMHHYAYSLPDSFQKKRTDTHGKVTFTNLPAKPEQDTVEGFRYVLAHNRELLVNDTIHEVQQYIESVNTALPQFLPQFVVRPFVIRPSALQMSESELMNLVFGDIQQEMTKQIAKRQSAEDFLKSLIFATDNPQKKKQLLIILNVQQTTVNINDAEEKEQEVMAEMQEAEKKARKLLQLLFYDPDISPVFQKYRVRGIRTNTVTLVKNDDGEEVLSITAFIDHLKKLDKSLENPGVITLCVLDASGKFLMSLPYERITGKTLNARGEEVETVLPGLLLPFLEALDAFAE